MEDVQANEDIIALETPPDHVFLPPSIEEPALVAGDSYTYFSPVPPCLLPAPATTATTATTAAQNSDDDDAAASPAATTATTPGLPCVLGVDEAGRGPVLGPMVYGVFYVPVDLSTPLLRTAHHFDDSKVLTPDTRSALMAALCTPGTDLHASCGWAISALSARDIGAGMLRRAAAYNLNAQAMDATVALIRGVLARGVDVREVFVDTVGQPGFYQKRLERVFPGLRITVAKKADSLFPCVSAASVCAKVTRDAAVEVLYQHHERVRVRAKPAPAPAAGSGRPKKAQGGGGDADDEEMEEPAEEEQQQEKEEEGWGSGYPSDGRCSAWLKRNMHPVFGWGPECRFSWSTAKDMLEAKGGAGVTVEWPVDEDPDTSRVTDFFVTAAAGAGDDREMKDADELGTWFGTPVGLEAF